MNSEVQRVLGELRQRFEELYGQRLVRLILFGSKARGDAQSGSDIDVLVVLQGPVQPGEEISRTGEITAGLSLAHDVVISCAYVSEERFQNEDSPLLINIRREGVPV